MDFLPSVSQRAKRSPVRAKRNALHGADMTAQSAPFTVFSLMLANDFAQ